jgi:hypothetical protein
MRAGDGGLAPSLALLREPPRWEQAAKTTSVNAERRGAWSFAIYWTRDWPRWLRIALRILLVIGIPATIILTGLDIDFRNMTTTRAETEREKNCLTASQALASLDHGLNSNIGALNNQMSILVQDMGEIRKKCLAEKPASDPVMAEPSNVVRRREAAECSFTPGSVDLNYSGRYSRVLQQLSDQEDDIRSHITALQAQQRQDHQRLAELCSSH